MATDSTTAAANWGGEENDAPECQVYGITEFMDYMSSNLLRLLPSNHPENPCSVFWFPDHDGHPPPPAATSQVAIKERIKLGLQNTASDWWDHAVMIQFWEPKSCDDGRRCLTTSRQPFALRTLYRGLSWYRKHCANQEVLVEGGPLGRVFQNGQPESSPDLRLYSTKEYPQRDQALSFGVRTYMVLPVFELEGDDCVGVLELVGLSTPLSPLWPLPYFELCQNLGTALKDFNLTLLHMDAQSDAKMFKVVNETPNIPLAWAWVPCGGCSTNHGRSCMQIACFSCDSQWNKQYDLVDCDFVRASSFHHLQPGKGVAGRALSSPRKLCFCRSIYGFNITEYPVAHYARNAMLAVSFAICLHSAHTGSDPYVLEFFMRPGNQDDSDPRSLIHALLVRMKQQLRSFKVASGRQLGEELVVEIVRFRMDDEPVYFQRSPSDRYPLGFEVTTPELSAEEQERSPSGRCEAEQPPTNSQGDRDVDSNAPALECNTCSSEEAVQVRKRLQISYEDLQSHFGKTREVAATDLGVSVSTFKRACKTHNISRWPYHIKNKANLSLFETKLSDKPAGRGSGSSGVNPSCSNLSAAPQQDLRSVNTRSTPVQDATAATLFTVKANYQSKTVKFQLGSSSGMAKLEEELAKRLKLKIGNFEMSYQDEDGCLINLTCDEDLWFCAQTLTALDLTTIQVSVHQAPVDNIV